jgi:uncharacterized membrane protein
MGYMENVRNFWMPFWVFLTLLGVYLVFFGIALAGLFAAQRKRETSRNEGRAD